MIRPDQLAKKFDFPLRDDLVAGVLYYSAVDWLTAVTTYGNPTSAWHTFKETYRKVIEPYFIQYKKRDMLDEEGVLMATLMLCQKLNDVGEEVLEELLHQEDAEVESVLAPLAALAPSGIKEVAAPNALRDFLTDQGLDMYAEVGDILHGLSVMADDSPGVDCNPVKAAYVKVAEAFLLKALQWLETFMGDEKISEEVVSSMTYAAGNFAFSQYADALEKWPVYEFGESEA